MINMLKIGRLVVAILMVATIVAYQMMSSYYEMPSLDLLVTIWVSIFVFLLGLQYHIEKKLGHVALFIMLFSIVMLIMTILGFIF